ncbi:Gfo/Idh/MocA family protein [Mucilaginibacter myungsuensis]|uniref:Gfo/Idh/MocA family oxidoreductase n=1 Tax=Mucilaginibacter myungsuensis TaxID=649104 RepID=A0A929L3Z6_9SPHI|nr:Gfo/Idh/MocA family oxidoreductase [Mucilaginibacter myungsuensis]MBE9663600.1 Gfo/Idh/MocA family oxidoreductase [Mucilaginibacter myungsuensis]MDN3599076.1 Gfo/Idh/MocA family oxidoreductase [Mucilaginibacter myungsuensis]
MPDQINWGIIGCGDVTEVKSGPAFNKVAGSKLFAVMRRDAEKAADYARRHNVPKWYSNADDLLNDPEVNAVYIATPPAFHLPYTLAALKRGLHVYVEKPVALNAAEAQQMADALERSTGKLVVAHYRRAVPMFLYVKELLDNKVIGDIRTVQIRMWQSIKPKLVANVADNWRVDPALSGGGYFHDLAPHQLDLMLYYFGKPVNSHGSALNQSGTSAADDYVSGQMLFDKKLIVNGSWCFNVSEDEVTDLCEIVGSRGKISFPFFGKTVEWHNDTDKKMLTFDNPTHIEQPMIERVVAYLNGARANPCSIDDAIIVMQMMDALCGTLERS